MGPYLKEIMVHYLECVDLQKKEMRGVAMLENPEVIRRILKHLGLWLAGVLKSLTTRLGG